MTTNDPRAQHKHYYDTPEGHDQPLEFMRNSVGNGAVGAAAGGELQPGRAAGGASLTASGGEPPLGGGHPPNDGARQEQVPLTHASSYAADDFVITDEDVVDVLMDRWNVESGNTPASRAPPLVPATDENEAANFTVMMRYMEEQFKRREAEHEKAMLELKSRLGSMENQQQALADENARDVDARLGLRLDARLLELLRVCRDRARLDAVCRQLSADHVDERCICNGVSERGECSHLALDRDLTCC